MSVSVSLGRKAAPSAAAPSAASSSSSSSSAAATATAPGAGFGQAADRDRLKTLALERGLVAAERPVVGDASGVPSELYKYHAETITSRATKSKRRFLFQLPGRFQPLVAAGTCQVGTLSKLNTNAPVMYLDWGARGRIKFLGCLLIPKARYLALTYQRRDGSKLAPMHCRQAFDSLVVFPDYFWIGRKEENPEERRLPWPADDPTVFIARPDGLPAQDPVSSSEDELDAAEVRAQQRAERLGKRKASSTAGSTAGADEPNKRARPSRAAAEAARDKFGEMDSDVDEGDEDSD